MRWRVLVMVGLALLGAGCGHGYEEDNRSIVAELPTLDDVVLVEEHHYSYCSGDTCLLGDDRSGALLTYSVDTERYTQQSLTEAYRQGLPDWEPVIEQGCANANPAFCDEILFASFLRGEERISLNLDNWSVGRFELHVDAKGGA